MSGEVQRWADSAMYQADPIDAQAGPKVYLLEMSSDPLGQIAAACKMYEGGVVRDLSSITDIERRDYLSQIQKTKLKAPFEFVNFHFLLEGVSRAFTHQLVRQRTAVYAQESLRFAVKEDMPQYLPPSLQGTYPTDEWIKHVEVTGALPDNEQNMRFIWDDHNKETQQVYRKLIEAGMPAEDARGRLPHDTLTRVHYSTDLRALQDHAGNRLCTQAQFEWRAVWAQIIKAIREYRPHHPFRDGSNAQWGRVPGFAVNEKNEQIAWQYEALADLFKPVCYLTGKCEFKANFDRPCKIRERVDANESIARPSSEWGQMYDPESGYTDGPPREGQVGGPPYIGPVKPGEWLLDPGAAR